MSDKCEWKDGKFVGCDRFDPVRGAAIQLENEQRRIYCKSCETLIDKPEPAEPLIVKSGGTWIYFAEGINYICIDPHIYTKSRPLNLNDFYSEIIHWKSFTGPNPDITELTDEIAKLRPIVRNTILIDCLYTLYGVTCGMGIVTGLEKPDLLRWIEMDHCRLATAQELQE